MIMNNFVIILLMVALLPACTGNTNLSLVPKSGQQMIYQHGKEYVVSGESNVIAVSAENEFIASEEHAAFLVGYLNRTNYPVDFSAVNLNIYVNRQLAKVLTFDEASNQIRSFNKLAIIGTTLQEIGSSLQGNTMESMYARQQSDEIKERMDYTNAQLLKKHTVFPGENYSGIVIVDLPDIIADAVSLSLIVEVNQETHVFEFQSQR